MVDTAELRNYIESIALREETHRGAAVEGDADLLRSGQSAQIDAGALQAFDKSLSGQDRADVSNSVLFAQLAANAKADRFAESAAWSKTYSTVLETVGWSVEEADAGSPVRIDPPVDWAEVVAEALAGWAGAPLAAKAMKAAAALPVRSEALQIWESNAAEAEQGNFIVQPCRVSNDDLISESAQVSFTLIREPEGFLAWATYYEVATSATKMVLNDDVYKQVRQQIIDKLGDRPKYYVAPVPL